MPTLPYLDAETPAQGSPSPDHPAGPDAGRFGRASETTQPPNGNRAHSVHPEQNHAAYPRSSIADVQPPTGWPLKK